MSHILEICNSMVKIVKWEVNSYSQGSLASSPYFVVHDMHFHIRVRAVSKHGSVTEIQLDLIKKDETSKINFNFEIGIEEPDGSVRTVKNKVFSFSPNEGNRGTQGFNLVEGPAIFLYRSFTAVCIVHLQQYTDENAETYSSTRLKDVSSQTVSLECIEKLSENFKELFASSRHADITIKVGNKEFRAHKSVLGARSPVLDSMFSHEMLENNTGVINIIDTDEDTFEAFLIFLYAGKIDQIVISKVEGLYEIADKYDMQELKSQCVKRLMIEMSIDVVCDALRLSSLHGEKLLFETATKFFVDNAGQVFDTEKWESFLKENFKIGNELLKIIVNTR